MRIARNTLFLALITLFCLTRFGFASAQEELTESAKVRIGYFAISPKAFDTYIDGELASFALGLTQLPDVVFESPWQSNGYRQYATTPFFTLPTGSHTIAFTPTGEGLDAAILGPEAVTLEDSRVYSIAIIGELEDDTLNLLVIDETGATSLESPAAEIFIHNIEGAPSLNISVSGNEIITGLEYGQYAIYHWTTNQGGIVEIEITDPDNPYTMGFTEFRYDSETLEGVSNLNAFVGSYSGGSNSSNIGRDYFSRRGVDPLVNPTIIDSGTVEVGDVISGELPEIRSRKRYMLTLDASTKLNISVERVRSGLDARLSIYDAQGNVLVWNDDNHSSSNPSIEDFEMAAGTYIIEVGSWADASIGQFELRVETVESD